MRKLTRKEMEKITKNNFLFKSWNMSNIREFDKFGYPKEIGYNYGIYGYNWSLFKCVNETAGIIYVLYCPYRNYSNDLIDGNLDK